MRHRFRRLRSRFRRPNSSLGTKDSVSSTSPDALSPHAQHRLANGITLEQIAESTKISIAFLRAIEAEEYAKLPGGVYDRSYVRQYGEAVGLDVDELLTRYERATRVGSCGSTSSLADNDSPSQNSDSHR
jgi:cytoskeletal protein RodZ